MLDPFPFGGRHTSYEALSLGLPVVTLPGEFLRGRLAYAMYRQMGYGELVAKDAGDYADLAVRLATQRDFRRSAQRAILDSWAALYDDAAIVNELEDFWLSVADP